MRKSNLGRSIDGVKGMRLSRNQWRKQDLFEGGGGGWLNVW